LRQTWTATERGNGEYRHCPEERFHDDRQQLMSFPASLLRHPINRGPLKAEVLISKKM
jgi:hypothetical protein